MKIINDLGIRYILKNKRKSMSIIFGIVIVTILLTTIITLISSYQQYLVQSVRSDKNWEIELTNIAYKDALKSLENSNIKEKSFTYKLGISEENFGKVFINRLNVQAFDDNSIKNNNLKITEGRLPENSNELAVSEARDIINNGKNESPTTIKVGDNIQVTLNGNKKDFLVVGRVENLDFDKNYFDLSSDIGAITYLDKSNLKNESLVDVTILTKNIQKVYETGETLKKELNINANTQNNEISESEMLQNILTGANKNQEDETPSIKYNEKLLKYECVLNRK